MKNNFLLLSLASVIGFYSSGALAKSTDILSAVKNYTYKHGEPYGLSQVYRVNSPDAGFPPYYIFLTLGVENAYAFVFNREGVSGKHEPYSRCNVVLKDNDQTLIPERKYRSGYAEDSEPCLGIDRLQTVRGSKGIKWYVADALYQSEGDSPDKTDKVYFYSDGNFCFSQTLSLKLTENKISMKDLNNLSLGKKDFEECAK